MLLAGAVSACPCAAVTNKAGAMLDNSARLKDTTDRRSMALSFSFGEG
jgi:hypothetical protein